jgi:hypothetical protein
MKMKRENYLEEPDCKFFCDIRMQGKSLYHCNLVYQGKCTNTRMYVSKGDNCFSAHAVRFVSSPTNCEDHWESKSLVVQTLFTATAFFDGVRHLEFNRNGCDMDGYLYYPPMGDLLEMLQKVREIELEVCRDAE